MFASGRFSTRAYLVAFSLALVVPVLLFGAWSLHYYAQLERARLESQAAQIARQLDVFLESNIGDLLALLRALASSSALLRDDLADFHAQAMRLTQGTDLVILLRTQGGEQLLNTQARFGAALPPAIALNAEDRAAYAAGMPRVSDVYASPISGEPRVAVALRPLPEQKPDYLLAVTAPTSRFHAAMQPAVPVDWIVGVGDRRGTYVTHSRRHVEVTGKSGSPAYLAQATGKAGTFYAAGVGGVPLLAGYSRSELTGWLVAANIPTELLEAPLRRSLFALTTAAAAVLATSALFAFLFSRRLAGSARALAARAAALGRAGELPVAEPGPAEFAVIDRALAGAATAVRERAALTRELSEALQQKELLLKEVNHRVKNSLQLVASLLSLQRGQIADAEARRQFEDAARRINTVAHIHQRLYQGERLDRVALDGVLEELCGGLDTVLPERKIEVACELAPCFLPTERVIPVALIVNELIANAFKYSFTDRPGGVIRVACREQKGAIVLSVSDEGAPLPEDFDPARSRGLGMRIVTALARQLHATLRVERHAAGKTFTLEVPIESASGHAA